MPPRDVRMYVHDMLKAGRAILRTIEHRSQAEFQEDEDLRAMVERRFEIIGEAMRQALDADPSLATRITDGRRIIDFRNFLIHGYHLVDPQIVWDIARTHLPRLIDELAVLLPGGPE